MNIKVGETYNSFDDGKIRSSRQYKVKITRVVPFSEIDHDTLSMWNEDVDQCHWLYKRSTDYFIFGELNIGAEELEEVVYVRTKDNGWFSMGWCAGRLDYDGSLLEELNNVIISMGGELND